LAATDQREFLQAVNEERDSRIHGSATRGVEMTIYLDDRPIRAYGGEIPTQIGLHLLQSAKHL